MESQISNLKFQTAWPAILIALVVFAARGRDLGPEGRIRSVPARRRSGKRFAMLAGTALLVSIGMVACGGGGSSSTAPDPRTPAGTYTIMATGTTSGGASQSIALTLTVQ